MRAAPPKVDWDRVVADLVAFGQRHRARITDVSLVLHRQMAQGCSGPLEGAQGDAARPRHRHVPVRDLVGPPRPPAVSTGHRRPTTRIDRVVGVEKAYHTCRQPARCRPSIMTRGRRDAARRGGEYGATTGRARRVGWFDGVAVRYTVRINGVDASRSRSSTCWTSLDEIPVCTGYRFEGETLTELPCDTAVLEECEPVYETFPGWKTSTAGVRDWSMLPENARLYVDRLASRRHRDRPRLHRPRPAAHDRSRPQRARELVRLDGTGRLAVTL